MTAKSNHLKDAALAYRAWVGDGIQPKAAALLGRLEASEEAIRAFSKFGAAADRVLMDCIKADVLARTFNERIRIERRLTESGGGLDKLESAVSTLRAFIKENVKEFDAKPDDPLGAPIYYHPDDVRTMQRGLYLVSNAIEGRRRAAAETPLRLGATRKASDGGKAARTAAIGWLAKSVRRICGRPHHDAVAALAEIFLEPGDVSIDRVRKAEQTFDRKWRTKLEHSGRKYPANAP